MALNVDMPTILNLPDGSRRELHKDSTGVQLFTAQNPRRMWFEIDGRRYGVESMQEFPYLPDPGGPVRVFDLVAIEPPTN